MILGLGVDVTLIREVIESTATAPFSQTTTYSGFKDLFDLYTKAQRGDLKLGDFPPDSLHLHHPLSLVYQEICTIAGRPETSDHYYEKNHAVENPPCFIQAIKNIALKTLDSLSTSGKKNEQNYVEGRICAYSRELQTGDLSYTKTIEKDDVEVLIKSLIDLDEFKQINITLNEWVAEAPSSGRETAQWRIITFLNNDLDSLALAGLELKSFPNISHFHSFKTKLTSLELSNNDLTTLPAEIGELINLNQLYLSGNCLAKLPKEIGKLKNLRDLDLSSVRTLTELPLEIFELPPTCKVELEGTGLSPATFEQLREATQIEDYAGPRFVSSMILGT